MYNPFDEITDRLISLEKKVSAIHPVTTIPPAEIINRSELCKRLDITEPTAIRWDKKGKLPSIRIGSNVRYNWPTVVEALERTGNNFLAKYKK